jgi:hypothetical protein
LRLAVAGVVGIGLTVAGLLRLPVAGLLLAIAGLLLRLAITRLLRLPVPRLPISGLGGLPVPRLARLTVRGRRRRLLGLGVRSTASRYESGSCEDEGCLGENRSFHGGSSGKGAKKGPVSVGLAPHVLFNSDFELLVF